MPGIILLCPNHLQISGLQVDGRSKACQFFAFFIRAVIAPDGGFREDVALLSFQAVFVIAFKAASQFGADIRDMIGHCRYRGV